MIWLWMDMFLYWDLESIVAEGTSPVLIKVDYDFRRIDLLLWAWSTKSTVPSVKLAADFLHHTQVMHLMPNSDSSSSTWCRMVSLFPWLPTPCSFLPPRLMHAESNLEGRSTKSGHSEDGEDATPDRPERRGSADLRQLRHTNRPAMSVTKNRDGHDIMVRTASQFSEHHIRRLFATSDANAAQMGGRGRGCMVERNRSRDEAIALALTIRTYNRWQKVIHLPIFNPPQKMINF